MFQKLTIVGRITQPEIKANAKGTMFIKMGIATQSSKDADTVWFNVILSGKFAEVMSSRLQKGQTVFCEAHATQNKGNDGQTYTNWFVDTLRIVNDGSNTSANAHNQQNAAPAAQAPGQPATANPSFTETYDDDLPF